MNVFAKFMNFVILMLIAMSLASIYGFLYSQVLYLIEPFAYFQNGIWFVHGVPEDFWNKWGAGWIGLRCSYWMGCLLGISLIIFSFCLFHENDQFKFVFRSYLVTLLFSLISGVVLYLYTSYTSVNSTSQFRMLTDYCYLHGMVGIAFGVLYLLLMKKYSANKQSLNFLESE